MVGLGGSRGRRWSIHYEQSAMFESRLDGQVEESSPQIRRKFQTLSQLDATQFYFCIELGKGKIEQCVE